MFVTFIGPPISGKTTTSSKLFADLKERGMSVEYLSEYARMYISSKRRLEGDTFQGLDDHDQYNILVAQATHEETLAFDPKLLVIADSCAMSAVLYMTDAYLNHEMMKDDSRWVLGKSPVSAAREAAKRYDVIFRCAPVRPGIQYDPNRIHSYEQALEVEKRVDFVLDLCGVPRSKVYPLFGDPKMRLSEAHGVMMPKLIAHLAEQK